MASLGRARDEANAVKRIAQESTDEQNNETEASKVNAEVRDSDQSSDAYCFPLKAAYETVNPQEVVETSVHNPTIPSTADEDSDITTDRDVSLMSISSSKYELSGNEPSYIQDYDPNDVSIMSIEMIEDSGQ
ncbi:hypothetical protein HDU99_004697, partial [Rhizoclosmatium hyalinum]